MTEDQGYILDTWYTSHIYQTYQTCILIISVILLSININTLQSTLKHSFDKIFYSQKHALYNLHVEKILMRKYMIYILKTDFLLSSCLEAYHCN